MGCCGHETRDQTVKRGSRCVLCRVCQILLHGGKTPWGDPCVVVPGHLIRKPDPCIYDQFMLMQLNQPVTWDNPDVRIFLNGIEQYTYNLTVGTDYDVEVTVHNSSRDKPALGTQVAVRWIEFGAGSQTRHAIATPVADVPIWPGTATVTVPWRTPDTPGHYCLEVELAHPNDGNPANNRGWNNTQVYAANSPVSRPIRIFNRYPRECPPVREGGGPVLRPHRVLLGWGPIGAIAALLAVHHVHSDTPIALRYLELFGAGYVIAMLLGFFFESAYAWLIRRRDEQRGKDPRRDRTECHLVEITVDSYEFEDKVGKDFDPAGAFQGKGPAWPATVDPPSFVFLPGEAYRDVELRVEAPDDPGPPGHFNVNVRQGGVPTGGVTVVITRGG
jgi:hypothetical protein